MAIKLLKLPLKTTKYGIKKIVEFNAFHILEVSELETIFISKQNVKIFCWEQIKFSVTFHLYKIHTVQSFDIIKYNII